SPDPQCLLRPGPRRDRLRRAVRPPLARGGQGPGLATTPSPPAVNTGLSNIATRSARLDPRRKVEPDPNNQRGVKRIDPAHSTPTDNDNALWIDRARVFQTQMGALTGDYGTVDSSINDINPEPGPFDPAGQPKNYCERQGRSSSVAFPAPATPSTS